MQGKNKRSKKKLSVVFIFIVFLLGIMPLSEAQNLLDTSNKFRFEPSIFFGIGIDEKDAFITNTGETVSLSAGGGFGGAITFGYGLSSKLDIDLTVGFERSNLSEDLTNADGSFDRNILLATLKYKIPFSINQQIKLGAGLGIYMSGEWDVDGSQVPGGWHEVIEYDTAIGFHITVDYEHMFSPKWSFSIGVKYYNVTYDANSLTINGVSSPVNLLNDEFRNLDGSGFDFILDIARYF